MSPMLLRLRRAAERVRREERRQVRVSALLQAVLGFMGWGWSPKRDGCLGSLLGLWGPETEQVLHLRRHLRPLA